MQDFIQLFIYKFSANIRPILPFTSCFFIMSTVGFNYTVGNYSPYILSYMLTTGVKVGKEDLLFITAFQGGLPFSYTIGGWIESRFGPRLTVLFGGFFVSTGLSLSYFTIKWSFYALVGTLSISYGLGMGLIINSVITTAMRWLPKHCSIASGLVVSSVGVGGILLTQVETRYVNPYNFPVNQSDGLFHDPELLLKVPSMFLHLGLAFAIVYLISSIFLCSPIPIKDSLYERNVGVSAKKMLKSTTYYWLFFSFFLMNSGTTVISYYKIFGERYFNDDEFLSIISSAAAGCLSVARIFWGVLAHKINFQIAMGVAGGFLGCFLVTFRYTVNNQYFFMVWICLISACHASCCSLFPYATAKCFGQENVAVNYGFVVLAEFISGIVASVLVMSMGKLDNDEFNLMWYVSAGCAFLTLLLAITINKTSYGKVLHHNSNGPPNDVVVRWNCVDESAISYDVKIIERF